MSTRQHQTSHNRRKISQLYNSLCVHMEYSLHSQFTVVCWPHLLHLGKKELLYIFFLAKGVFYGVYGWGEQLELTMEGMSFFIEVILCWRPPILPAVLILVSLFIFAKVECPYQTDRISSWLLVWICICKLRNSFLCPPYEDKTGSHWVRIRHITIKAHALCTCFIWIHSTCLSGLNNKPNVFSLEALHLNITVFTRKLHRIPLSLLLVLPALSLLLFKLAANKRRDGKYFSGVSTHAAISSPIWTEIVFLCLCSSAWNLILSHLGSGL